MSYIPTHAHVDIDTLWPRVRLLFGVWGNIDHGTFVTMFKSVYPEIANAVVAVTNCINESPVHYEPIEIAEALEQVLLYREHLTDDLDRDTLFEAMLNTLEKSRRSMLQDEEPLEVDNATYAYLILGAMASPGTIAGAIEHFPGNEMEMMHFLVSMARPMEMAYRNVVSSRSELTEPFVYLVVEPLGKWMIASLADSRRMAAVNEYTVYLMAKDLMIGHVNPLLKG